jgi:hypothetical protein
MCCTISGSLKNKPGENTALKYSLKIGIQIELTEED